MKFDRNSSCEILDSLATTALKFSILYPMNFISIPFRLEAVARSVPLPGKVMVIFYCAPFRLHTRSKDNEAARRRLRRRIVKYVEEADPLKGARDAANKVSQRKRTGIAHFGLRTMRLRTTFTPGAALSGWRCWQVARGQRSIACPAASVASIKKGFLQRGQLIL
jgi:hypothetical protein